MSQKVNPRTRMRVRDSFKTPLIVELMPSGKRFRLHCGFTYLWKPEYLEIRVKAGFVTDFASIPRLARLIIPKLGRHNKAAVIHDAIYQGALAKPYNVQYGGFTRRVADKIFLNAMQDLGVPKWKRTLMYWAVRLFGGFAWRKQ